MADLTKLSTAGIDGVSANRCAYITENFAGEDLGKVDACYIASDGKVYKAVSSQVTISGIADFSGFTNRVVPSGQPVTLFGAGAIFGYASALTPGQYLYVSNTAGKLSDTKIASADLPVAKAIDLKNIIVARF